MRNIITTTPLKNHLGSYLTGICFDLHSNRMEVKFSSNCSEIGFFLCSIGERALMLAYGSSIRSLVKNGLCFIFFLN